MAIKYDLITGEYYKMDDIIKKPKFKKTLDSINSLLEYKNEKYGNAALEPLGIFEGKCKVFLVIIFSFSCYQ